MRFIPIELEQCDMPPIWGAYQRVPFYGSFQTDLTNLHQVLDSEDQTHIEFGKVAQIQAELEATEKAQQRTYPVAEMTITGQLERNRREKVQAVSLQALYRSRYAWISAIVMLVLIGIWSAWPRGPASLAAPTADASNMPSSGIPMATPTPVSTRTAAPLGTSTDTPAPTITWTGTPTPASALTLTQAPTAAPTRVPTKASTAAYVPPAVPSGRVQLVIVNSADVGIRVALWGPSSQQKDISPGQTYTMQIPTGEYGWNLFGNGCEFEQSEPWRLLGGIYRLDFVRSNNRCGWAISGPHSQ